MARIGLLNRDIGTTMFRPGRPSVKASAAIRNRAIGFTWRLVCWADEPITFDAWWPEIPEGAGLGGACMSEHEPAGFLFCQHINYNGLTASPDEGFDGRLSLSIDPASGVTMPPRGQSVRVTGRFDHAAADACAALAGPDQDPVAAVFICRLQLVPTLVEPLGS